MMGMKGDEYRNGEGMSMGRRWMWGGDGHGEGMAMGREWPWGGDGDRDGMNMMKR